MLNVATNTREEQSYRLRIKTLSQQMQTLAVAGAGLAPWAAQVLVEMIEEVYFSDPLLRHAAEGQLKYACVSTQEGAGKPLAHCRLVTVVLSLFDAQDDRDLVSRDHKDRSIEIRRRRLVAQLLMSDVRTIRRDVAALKREGIIVATRGQQKDIGPGVSHRGLAVRHWLEGQEPVEVARQIKHSLAAVERYLETFKRVAYLRAKGFDRYEIALTVGISLASTASFLELYEQFRHKSFFRQRLAEIDLAGSQFYWAEGEKKGSASSSAGENGWRAK
jgi:hypothetical protein